MTVTQARNLVVNAVNEGRIDRATAGHIQDALYARMSNADRAAMMHNRFGL